MSIIAENDFYEPFDDEKFKYMPSADGGLGAVLQHYILGDVSAKNEWEKPDKARNTFMHLSAYEHFINNEQLLLLGRTGSGKSSIIYSLKDDIENGTIDSYTDVIQIDEKDFCEELANMCYNIDINRFDATNKITKAITMTIYITVMLYCVEKYGTIELETTTKFLESKGFIHSRAKSVGKTLIELTSEETEKIVNAGLKSQNITNAFAVARVLIRLHSIIKSNSDEIEKVDEEYNKALSEVKQFLQNENKEILVLLDSFDEYKIDNKPFVVGMKSTILACFNIFTASTKSHIYFKMAIASEIYTRVLTHLPAQNQTNTVAILWTFKELINCMALRLVSWFYDEDARYKDKRYLFAFLGNYNVSQFKGDSKSVYTLAEDIFYKFLPKICNTNSSYTYLTLAFISRHTMKKPREILQIFNAILDRIIYENDSGYFINNKGNDKIKDIVHSLQNEFINQNLALYKTFIPKIEDYIQELLSRSDFIFKIDSTFEDKLKKVNALVQADVQQSEYLSYFDKFDILSIIFETGLLGKVSMVRTVDAKGIEQFGTDKSIKIINALFEYQYKGNLKKNKETQYVIHPMCYEHFNCNVGMRSMVNTDCYDKTELLSSIILPE